MVRDVENVHLNIHVNWRLLPHVIEGGPFREAHPLSYHSEKFLYSYEIYGSYSDDTKVSILLEHDTESTDE